MGRPFEINLGINDLQRQLANIDKYDEATQEKLHNTVKTSTTNIMAGAKRRVSIKTGNLIKGIKMSYDPATNVGTVTAKSRHAHLVEYGAKGAVETHKKKKALHGGAISGYADKVKIPARKEHPFMRPAFEDERPNLIRNVEAAIKS